MESPASAVFAALAFFAVSGFSHTAALNSICPLRGPCTLSLLHRIRHCLVSSEDAFSGSKPLLIERHKLHAVLPFLTLPCSASPL